jgi:DNA-binding HxlR family transcriptional regulator
MTTTRTTATRSYGQFCMLAEALDQVGDRWTLLVVRDLAGGSRRFTDLMERLSTITPKTLSQRLRDLEGIGLVEVDRRPGRREVWYQLTPAGRDLLPALDELMLWGLRHAARSPEPGEPAHPEHILWALRLQLEREGVDVGDVRWLVRLADDGSYVISGGGGDGGEWRVEPGEVDDAAVVVDTTKAAWAGFLARDPSSRSTDGDDVRLTGSRSAVRTFMKALAVFPFGRQTRVPARSRN